MMKVPSYAYENHNATANHRQRPQVWGGDPQGWVWGDVE